MSDNFKMNASLRGLGRNKLKGWKFWAKLSIVLIVLVGVLIFFSPSFHDKHFGVAQNEAAAVGSLRRLNSLENQYVSVRTDKGFACELPLLQPIQDTKEAFGRYATLLTGVSSGYRFAIVDCVPSTSGIVSHYAMTAIPTSSYGTGVRAFCTDESGSIFYDPTGSGSECLAAKELLP